MHPATKRWQLAEEISNKMGVSKSEGFSLIVKLTEVGLLQGVLNGEPEAIANARKLEWFGKARPEMDEKANGVSIMLWAIRKIGSVDEAKKAFEKACTALS